MTIERRSAPMTILSLARSKSSMSTRRLFLRAAKSAASLTRLARSAPEKPGVPRAMISALTSGATGTFLMCTSRICSRPRISGSGTTTCRSNLPGRKSAGSSTSGRLVAAMTITPVVPSNPSISTKSWLSVCSRSSLPAHRVDFVDEHDAGGVFLRLVEHVANARSAHADEHFHEVGPGNRKERHFRLSGDRARKQRLSRAGVADHQHALRDAAAELLELGGIAQEIDQLGNFILGLFAAGDIGEGDAVVGLIDHPRAGFSERERAAPSAALHLAHEKNPHADEKQHREPRDEDIHEERRLFLAFRLDFDPVLEQVGDEPDVPGRVAVDGLPVGGLGLEVAPFDHHLGDATGLDLLHELRIVHHGLDLLARVELVEHRHQDEPDDEPND